MLSFIACVGQLIIYLRFDPATTSVERHLLMVFELSRWFDHVGRNLFLKLERIERKALWSRRFALVLVCRVCRLPSSIGQISFLFLLISRPAIGIWQWAWNAALLLSTGLPVTTWPSFLSKIDLGQGSADCRMAVQFYLHNAAYAQPGQHHYLWIVHALTAALSQVGILYVLNLPRVSLLYVSSLSQVGLVLYHIAYRIL